MRQSAESLGAASSHRCERPNLSHETARVFCPLQAGSLPRGAIVSRGAAYKPHPSKATACPQSRARAALASGALRCYAADSPRFFHSMLPIRVDLTISSAPHPLIDLSIRLMCGERAG